MSHPRLNSTSFFSTARARLAALGLFAGILSPLLLSCEEEGSDPEVNTDGAGGADENSEDKTLASGGSEDTNKQGTGGETSLDSCDEAGATRELNDGCNTCICSDGAWACTQEECITDPECFENEVKPTEGGCGGTCACKDGAWECPPDDCDESPTDCTPGDSSMSDDGSGNCYFCTCIGYWDCYSGACPHVEVCTEGDLKDADDDCNTCECENNAWTCTDDECPVYDCGGIIGNSCAEGDYCHLEPTDGCGAFDALGTCSTPPTACELSDEPVCGCDGNNYSNACFANKAGFSAASIGACD